MVSNETQKIKVLHQQFTDLLQTQQARGANAGNMTVEVSAKLGSIKVMLELLLNDRDAVKGSNKSLDSSSSDASKRNEATTRTARPPRNLKHSRTSWRSPATARSSQ